MNKRKAIPYGVLLVVFLIWVYLKPQEILTALPEHHPSFISHHLDSTHFDESGVISYKITAIKSTHFSNQENTLFEQPKVTFYKQNNLGEASTVWELSAQKGVLSGTNKLLLSDDVWLKNITLDQFVQTMHTQQLEILLTEKEISSDLLVQWEGPQIKQQGVGMWASFATEELIINKQIEAVYLNETK